MTTNNYYTSSIEIDKIKADREAVIRYMDSLIAKYENRYEPAKEQHEHKWIPNENCFVYGKNKSRT